ncbi:D-glucuronyl C5-epimerase family protein [Thermoanaerobacter siderophilus]|uniref:Thioredoxin domain-containing protein n=1 Tax=Thermoanaerobacter siderophilus SR4 TaxID=880478 RepID=I9AF66_9THEO|nr:D-glucuronyl C5-epimerase family protein [Thermoanaerobacter siderophilus]EIW00667.1 thioredoxin domain-containing protein [Thermoanaerobacter siderophilus SR4]
MRYVRILSKYLRILLGKSALHVNQGIGKIYSKEGIKGYYNDLTLKINWHGETDKRGLPMNVKMDGEKIYFPTTVIQYGLGNYDLYLLTKQDIYFEQFWKSVDWVVNEQDELGGWDVFERIGSKKFYKYSAMTQGEGASLLIRAFQENGDEEFVDRAKKAIDLMLLPVEKGGTARYVNDKLFLEEVVESKPVLILNGWIFAVFGLYDIFKATSDGRYKEALQRTLDTLKDELYKYDTGYWSYYDQCGNLASPFYHKLHIALLEVLYELFNTIEFKTVKEKWESYLSNKFKRTRAFIVKAYQKIKEPGEVVLIK